MFIIQLKSEVGRSLCVSHNNAATILVSATNLGLHKGGKCRKSEKCRKMSENVRRVSGTNKRSENIGNVGRVSGTNKKSDNIRNVRRVSGTNKKGENVGRHWKTLENVGRGRVRSRVKIWYVTINKIINLPSAQTTAYIIVWAFFMPLHCGSLVLVLVVMAIQYM